MPVLDYLPFDFFFVGKKNCISNLFNCLAFSFCYLAKEPDPNWHTGWAAFPLALPAEAALLSYMAEMVWGWRHRPWFWDQLCYSQRVGCLWSNRLHKLQTCLFLSVKWVCEKGHQSPPFSHSLMFFSSELIFSYKAGGVGLKHKMNTLTHLFEFQWELYSSAWELQFIYIYMCVYIYIYIYIYIDCI